MIEKAKKILSSADAILITAGAGMGVDSGLPDFRGTQGFWRAYPAIKDLGYRFEEMANPGWFKENPSLAWAFYGHRLNLYKKTKPHDGFYKLLEFAKEKKDGYFVFTSNVDGQFQKAGFSDDCICEVHGSIHYLQCVELCSRDILCAKNLEIKIDHANFKALEPLPKCPKCNALQRPNILMFGDWEWIEDRTNKQNQKLQHWLDNIKMKNSKLAILEFGAGTGVPTVRRFSESLIHTHSASLIRINPRDFEVPKNQISFQTGAKEAIDNLFNRMFTN